MNDDNIEQKDIIIERILIMLKQPSMTSSDLEYIENMLHSLCHLRELYKYYENKPKYSAGLFPKIDPDKYTYTSGKNDIVCRNCFNFTHFNTVGCSIDIAKPCEYCVNGSSYCAYTLSRA